MSRIRADKFVNNGANGAPQLTFGAEVVAGVGLTGAGGVNITGIATAASFSGATGSFSGDVDIADKIVHTSDTNTAIRFPANDTFSVETSGSERLRVNSSGNIGINSTIPRSKLHVANGNSNYNPGNPTGLGAGAVASLESSGDVALQFLSSTSTDNFIYFGDTDSATTGSIQYDHNVNALSFNVSGGTERLRILSDGTVATGGLTATPGTVAAGSYIQAAANAGFFNNGYDGKFGTSSNHPVYFQVNGSSKASITTAGNLSITDGDLVIGTSGHGIDFSATADGTGMTSELLDDYEEGNGTPTVSFESSGTATIAAGANYKYVKIGDLVTFSFEFNLSAVSNPAGGVKINLPFASGGGVYSAGAVRLYNVTFTGSPFLQIGPSSSHIAVLGSVSGSANSQINGTGFYFGTISYRTSP